MHSEDNDKEQTKKSSTSPKLPGYCRDCQCTYLPRKSISSLPPTRSWMRSTTTSNAMGWLT